MRRVLFVIALIFSSALFCTTGRAQNVELFKSRLIGVWQWEKGYLCGVGEVEPPPDSVGVQKKKDIWRIIFYPDQTIERTRNDTLVRKSNYTVSKVQTFPDRVAFKIKSDLFKGYALVTYFYNDQMIISNCVWEDYNVRKKLFASNN